MAKTNFKTVDEYFASLPPEQQEVLGQVRAAILAGVPGDAEEVISYQIPAVKHHGWVFYYSAYAKHFSLSCPPPFAAFVEFAEELAPYKRSTSAVQFRTRSRCLPASSLGCLPFRPSATPPRTNLLVSDCRTRDPQVLD